jgi:hypothetical protein
MAKEIAVGGAEILATSMETFDAHRDRRIYYVFFADRSGL